MSHLELHRPGRRPRPLARLLASALVLGAGAAVAQPPPPISKGCHPPPPKADRADASGFYTADLTGKPLEPGGSRKTLGTNDTESPELQTLKRLVERRTPFTLHTNEGDVEGTLHQVVDRGTDTFCKCHWQVSVSPASLGCIARARIGNFDLDGLQVVADYRDDLGGTVRPKFATRTEDGLSFDFVFEPSKLLCAGMTSRWLLLDTEWEGEVAAVGLFQAIGPQGEEGQAIPAFAPVMK
jgi:hypothetical protein